MKKMNRLMIVFILFTGLILLAACGGGDTTTPEPTAAPTNTSAPDTPVPPTATPVPPTATPEPTATPDVTAGFSTFESAESGVKVRYPSDWVSQDVFGFLMFATNQELFDNPNSVDEGAIALIISGDLMDLETTDPMEAFDIASAEFSGDDQVEILSGPDTVEINGMQVAKATIRTTSDDGTEITGIFAVMIGEEAGGVFAAFTPSATAEQYLPTFEAMLSTVQLSAPTVTDIGTTDLPETEGFLLPGDVVENSVEDEDGDTWSYIGLEGEVVDITVEPTGDLDVIVDVLDAEGNSIIGGELDDQFGTETITALAFPASGDYYVVVKGFAGGTGDYTLTIVESGTGSSGGITPTGDLSVGTAVEGSITGDETASWTFGALESDFIDVVVTPLDDDLDVVVDVLGPDGKSLFDEPTDDSFDTEIIPVIIIPEDGLYTVTVTGFEGSVGDYELLVRATNNGETHTIFFVSDSSIDEADEEHQFPFNALEGDTVTAIIEPLETEFDVVLSLYNDDTDELIEEVDASFGLESHTFEVPESGNYYFLVNGFDGSTGTYDAAFVGSETVIYELAVGDEVYAKFGEGALLQYYLGGDPGDTVTIMIEPDPDTDVVLRITDLDGNILVEDVDLGFSGEAETLEYTFGDEGLVIIEVVDFWEVLGTFSLTIE